MHGQQNIKILGLCCETYCNSEPKWLVVVWCIGLYVTQWI